MINKRLLIESVIFSLVVIVLWVLWQVLQGYLLTLRYVPDIANGYRTADVLESKVAFGVIYRPDWLSYVSGIGIFIVLAMVYYGIRTFIRRLVTKNQLR